MFQWTWAGFVAIYMKWVLQYFFMLFARDFQTSVFDILGFPHSFFLYLLGQLTSSLSKSCFCRHCFLLCGGCLLIGRWEEGNGSSPLSWVKGVLKGTSRFQFLKQRPGSSWCHSQTDVVSVHSLRNRCVDCCTSSLSEIMKVASTWEILVRKKINGKTMFQSIASLSNLLLECSSVQRWNHFMFC